MEEIRNKISEWQLCSSKFIREAILAPYNKKHGQNHKLSAQQQRACDEIDKLVRAKMARSLGADLDSEMAEYARKIGISIMSGQGTGKDMWTSCIIIWFMVCFAYCKIPCTANSRDQLRVVLWSEIAKWLKHSLVADWLVWQASMVYFREAGGKEWFAVPRTANTKSTAEEQAETLQGFHADNMMIVIDEASGIPDPVFRPLEGTLTGPLNFIIMIFNPTRRTGYAVESHTKYSEDWITLHWDAEESELVSIDHIRRMEKKYGRDSNPFRIRVKGLPPTMDEGALIPWEWIMDAVNRDLEPEEDAPRMAGIDVGGGHDKSIFLWRKGPVVQSPIKEYSTPDTNMLVSNFANDMDTVEADVGFVDVIGLGHGVYYGLKNLKYRAVAVDVRRKPKNHERYFSLRDELWWETRNRFEEGTISIPDDDDLIDQLAVIKYDDKTGKVKVEDKDSIRRRLDGSPDKADALMMTFYRPDKLYKKSRREHLDRYDKAFERENQKKGSFMVA